MPFGILSGVTDLITHAKFDINRLRVAFLGGSTPKCHFL